MPVVEDQLREYFDAGVERISVADILAQAEVRERKPAPPLPMRRRPAWAALGAFALTIVVMGGLLFAGRLMRTQELEAGAGTPATAIEPGPGDALAGDPWPALVLFVGGVAALAAWAYATRSNRRKPKTRKKVEAMATMEKTPVREESARIEKVEKRNRWLIVAVVVLALLAVALGVWLLVDALSTSETAAPAEVEALLSDYVDAWNAHDGEAAIALMTSGAVHEAGPTEYTDDSLVAHIDGTSLYETEITPIGDVVVMGDGDPYYYAASASRAAYVERGVEGGILGISVYSIMNTTDGLKIMRHSWIGE